MTFLNEILDISPKLNEFNEELFLEYISMIEKRDHPNIFKQESLNREVVLKPKTNWNQYIKNVQKCSNTGFDLIMKYLTHFCWQKGSLNSFHPLGLHSDIIKGISRQVAMLSTTDGLESLSDITPDHFKLISEQVFLRFAESNKEIFTIEEEVSLRLNVKNVK